MKFCDHRSVGVVLTDPVGRFLLLTRAKPPTGRAPVAGHVDGHGQYPVAAVAEAEEEAGLSIDGLHEVDEGWVPNICRRPPSRPVHDGHDWVIYAAREAEPSTATYCPDETRGGYWYTPGQVQDLAERTVRWAAGYIRDDRYLAAPGLEPVWVYWLSRLGHITVDDRDLAMVAEVYRRPPTI